MTTRSPCLQLDCIPALLRSEILALQSELIRILQVRGECALFLNPYAELGCLILLTGNRTCAYFFIFLRKFRAIFSGN